MLTDIEIQKDRRVLTDMKETTISRQERRISWIAFTVEAKLLRLLGGPLVAVTLAQYLLPIISMMMVGHLGELVLIFL